MRHADHYTVVGNHLAQHRALSLVAIGLALHIQSLPAGAKVGIKALADRFPEGEVRIAAALRELEAHGYLERSRVRTPEGRVLTRTVSYNRPRGAPLPQPPQPLPLPPQPLPLPPQPLPQPPQPLPLPPQPPPATPVPETVLEPVPVSVPVVVSPPVLAPVPEVEAECGAAPVRAEAVDLLARLRADDPRLLLAERDVRRLAPGVSGWLDRGADPEAVRQVLSASLPADLRHPAALIAHRLKAGIPPRMPAPAAPDAHARRPDPLQTCDGCERAFRAPAPGRCRDCPPDPAPPAVA
ncbi:helix-turn-helix domain-containing protein [Streptomyces sp. NPDC059982]|uniref:helix-turn-helix domain-containing protein n=1 Tax=unclassified Streptomyces TaxID=2593676 RepID=UPI0036B26BD5